MDIGQAVRHMEDGGRVRRAGWNGKGMFLFLIPGSEFTVSEGRPMARHYPVGTPITYLPHIDMHTATGAVVPWLASQTDILAKDWEAVMPTVE